MENFQIKVNSNEWITYKNKNLQNTNKTLFWGKVLVLHSYSRKEEKKLSSQFKKFGDKLK